MKTLASVFFTVLGLALQANAQDKLTLDSPGSNVVPAASPTASPTAARILGPIPDGPPPLLAPPEPAFVVPRKDILEITSHEQDGRTITIQRINPIALPQPETAVSRPNFDDSAFRDRVAKYRAEHPPTQIIALGATVYRSKDSPPRTLVTYRPGADRKPVTFWSSADFSLLAGIQNYVGSDGQVRNLILMWSAVDIDHRAASLKEHGSEYSAPNVPDFAAGKATFAIVGNPPAAEDLVSIQSLHDLYNNEYLRLKTAYEGRERARLQREDELKANPPQPKDITLNYWRLESNAPTKGGEK